MITGNSIPVPGAHSNRGSIVKAEQQIGNRFVLARLWGGEAVSPPRKAKAPLFRYSPPHRARCRRRIRGERAPLAKRIPSAARSGSPRPARPAGARRRRDPGNAP